MKSAINGFLILTLLSSYPSLSWGSAEKIKLDVTFKNNCKTTQFKTEGALNQTKTHTQGAYRFEVTPKLEKSSSGPEKDQILVTFKIFETKDNKENLLITPSLVMLNRNSAILRTKHKDEPCPIEIQVLPELK